ncbi:MAG: hypothetical protein R3C15_09200 [Thermoleophilia bacterium]
MRVVATLLAAGLAGLALAASAGARTAADVPIVGANAIEEAAIRAALAPLGDHVAVAQLTLDPNRVLVASCGSASIPSAWTEASWQIMLLRFELPRRLAAAGAAISGVGYCDADYHPALPPPAQDVDLDAIARAIRARARSNHLTVSIEQLRLPEPALRVVVHLYERQLLKRVSTWRSMVLPPEADRVARLLRVESPQGVPLFVESWARDPSWEGGMWRGYGALDGDAPHLPVPSGPVPFIFRGPSRFAVRLSLQFEPSEPRRRRYRIVCGERPRGIPHARRVCDAVVLDRWALLSPQQRGSDEVCSGGAIDEITIGGVIGGRRLGGRTYRCELATVARWAVLLGARPPGWGGVPTRPARRP